MPSAIEYSIAHFESLPADIPHLNRTVVPWILLHHICARNRPPYSQPVNYLSKH